MKKNLFFLLFASFILNFGCTNSSTNVIVDPHPAFIVSGLTDAKIVSGGQAELAVTVTYEDSNQQQVVLSLSPLPAGITVDSAWTKSGYPNFSTYILFYDTSVSPATPGTYAMTLTATGSISGAKTYPFNLVVSPLPLCSSTVAGKYVNCTSTCTSTVYTDSVYSDATVPNKIWFSNFENTGQKIYGTLECSSGEIIIPSQILNGNTVDGEGSFSSHRLSISMYGSTSCNVQMN